MTVPEHLWQFAGMTTAVGMGVVFVALFLLSVYMHLFKDLTARIEGRDDRARPKPAAPKPAPAVEPKPEEGPGSDDDARTAAAAAVALHLDGASGAPSPETAVAIGVALALDQGRAAAIATALALHRGAAGSVPRPAQAGTAWGTAGRLAAMAARVARQERAFR